MSDNNFNNKYDYLCIYDFKISDDKSEKDKAYIICYMIMKYPKNIFSESELNEFIKNFDKNNIKTILCKKYADEFLEKLPDKTLCYGYDNSNKYSYYTINDDKYNIISYFNYSSFTTTISAYYKEEDRNLYSREVTYKNKKISFKEIYQLIPYKLSEFPRLFKLGEYQREIIPQNIYTCENIDKYLNTNFMINDNNYKEIEQKIISGFKNPSDYKEFKEIVNSKFDGIFNIKQYLEYYCKYNVEIMTKALFIMRTKVYNFIYLDCFEYSSNSSIINQYIMDKVDSQTDDENLYNVTGVLNQYIKEALYCNGSRVSYRNSKLLVDRILASYDVNNSQLSAMKRLYIVTGKCKKFEKNELEMINNSMYDKKGNFNNKNCWLLQNTNKEDENDKNKINAYVVTIKIKDSKIKRNCPRIIVKNYFGEKSKYPNLPTGNIRVNVDPNVDLNNPKYKNYYVNEAIVTVDNIMLEDYIKFHDIEFEVIAGLYWKNNECTSSYNHNEYKSSKHFEIRNIAQKFYDTRMKYKKENNSFQEIIKMLVNSSYSYISSTYKKINYIKDCDKKCTQFFSNKDKRNKLKKINDYREKVKEQFKNNKITENEYKSKIDDLNSIIIEENGMYCDYSPYISFFENNMNKIAEETTTNNNMHIILTNEEIKNQNSNLAAVQILSMCNRIMNEVICLAEDLGINIYHQNIDNIQVEYSQICKLEEEYEKMYGRKLIGNQLGQFHLDFDSYEFNNETKNNFSLSKKLIVIDNYVYIDQLFNMKPEIENNEKLKENSDNYYIRINGCVSKDDILPVVNKLGINPLELYMKLFNEEELDFNLFDKPKNFEYSKEQAIIYKLENLNREAKSKNNKYRFRKTKPENIKYIFKNDGTVEEIIN